MFFIKNYTALVSKDIPSRKMDVGTRDQNESPYKILFSADVSYNCFYSFYVQYWCCDPGCGYFPWGVFSLSALGPYGVFKRGFKDFVFLFWICGGLFYFWRHAHVACWPG